MMESLTAVLAALAHEVEEAVYSLAQWYPLVDGADVADARQEFLLVLVKAWSLRQNQSKAYYATALWTHRTAMRRRLFRHGRFLESMGTPMNTSMEGNMRQYEQECAEDPFRRLESRACLAYLERAECSADLRYLESVVLGEAPVDENRVKRARARLRSNVECRA